MLQVIRWLKGYLSIKVWGFSPERFMNLCSNHNILLWNIADHGTYYSMCISLKGFYRLKGITRKTKTRVVVTKRYGLPFFSVRLRRRKIFIAGFCCSLAFWIFMSGFIWNIELIGNFYVTEDVFFDFLSEQGISSGMKKKEVDIEKLEKAIRNEYGIVTWTSARIDGTRLVVQIRENDLVTEQKKEEENAEDKEGYDLIADRDGTVISIVTRSGIPLITEGAEVKKGDMLVEGSIPIYNEDATVRRYEYCKADADILLKSKVSLQEQIKEAYEKKLYTGREKTKHFIMFRETAFSLPQGRKKYENYDKLREVKQICFFDSLYLPVYYGKTQIREYKLKKMLYTKEEIKIRFEDKIQKFIQSLEEKGVQIAEKNVTINKNKGIWKMQADFTMIQNAGVLKKSQKTLLENEQGE